MLEVINTQWLYRETVVKIKETPKTITVRTRTGEVIIDEVYRPLVGDLIDIGERPKDIVCLQCGKLASRKDLYFVCECGRSVREGLLGWTVPNLEEVK